MGFNQAQVDSLLAACHRRCCICHKFCGVKMELHHIEQAADGGSDDLSNAVPLCFECHAEIGLYNDKHPRGRKFHPNELRHHRTQWLDVCKDRPETLMDAPQMREPGSLERLLHELEFDSRIAGHLHAHELGCPFETGQFVAAIASGTLLWLEEKTAALVDEAYIAMRLANAAVASAFAQPLGNGRNTLLNEGQDAVRKAGE
ncbi:MAG: HNH endonuclease, partial [Planctomycetes bacterium]|nr:HNH endonuclease [Planctomycetota bacterium]